MLLPNGRAEVEGRREEGNRVTERLLISEEWEREKNQACMPLMRRMKTNTRAGWEPFFLSLRRGNFLWYFFFFLTPSLLSSNQCPSPPSLLSSLSLSSSHSIPPSLQQPSQLQVIRLILALWHTKSDDKLIAPSWWKEQRKDGRWWALIRNFGKSSPLQPWALHEKMLPSLTFSVSFFSRSLVLSLPTSLLPPSLEGPLSRRKRKVVLPASLVFT